VQYLSSRYSQTEHGNKKGNLNQIRLYRPRFESGTAPYTKHILCHRAGTIQIYIFMTLGAMTKRKTALTCHRELLQVIWAKFRVRTKVENNSFLKYSADKVLTRFRWAD
jgi:hypothetical protein